MKISIWQQFSSNHSASFTVVGEFESPERAKEVADELRAIVAIIASFWDDLDEAGKKDWRATIEQGGVTPPEEKFRDKYQVEWARSFYGNLGGIDWLRFGVGHAMEAVGNHGCYVTVENTADTWVGPKPFDDILEKLGGKVLWEVVSGPNILLWSVYFSAKDVTTAEYLEQLIQGEFNKVDRLTEEERKNIWLNPNQYNLSVFWHNMEIDEEYTTFYREGLQLGLENLWMLLADWENEAQGLARFETFLAQHGAIEIRFKPTLTK